jgi:4-hydroxyphenylacetate 3-monooxygenase
MVKTGDMHLEALRDGRNVLFRGTRVEDVTAHDAFKNAVASAAALYDFQAKHLEEMTFASPATGELVNKAWQLPKTYDALLNRRQALEKWAALHYGFMGRSPDHVASCISGMMMGIETFEAYDKDRAGALRDYYAYARDQDHFLTYVIMNPQADRSKPASEQNSKFLSVAVVDENQSGLTVRGAKMLGTSAIMANEVLVTCIQPLQPGDEKHALSFAIPIATKGLKILSRKSYEEAAPSVFDNPLSSRYDENDAVLYFDDVKIPWERIFVNQSIEMCQKQFHGTPAHVFQNYQSQIRLVVKMRFLAGLAHRTAEINGIIGFPQVREMLGQLAADVGLVEGLLYGMEAKGQMAGDFYVPDRQLLYTAQVQTQALYAKVNTALRELAGGGMITLPSGAEDFDNPEMADLIGKTQQSPAASSEERVKFFKLAWDAVGSEFASRHVQYEMFYAGASFVTKGHAYRTFDWDGSAALVDDLLKSTPGPRSK